MLYSAQIANARSILKAIITVPVQAYRGATAPASVLETVVFDLRVMPAAFAAGEAGVKALAGLRRWRGFAPTLKQEMASCLVLAEETGRVLLFQRPPDDQHAGTWGTWIGPVDAIMSPVHAVALALDNAMGYDGEFAISPLSTHRQERSVVLRNHVAVIPSEFAPAYGSKAHSFMWCRLAELPRPLHPDLVRLLDDSACDLSLLVDLHARARAMADIEL